MLGELHVKNESNFIRIIYLVVGIIGPVVIGAGFLRMQLVVGDVAGAFWMLMGFFLILFYIEFLEKKAGLSAKYRWTRAIASMVLFAGFSFYFYLL
ncbi:hypothetical protein ATG70_0556 [Bacillus sp. es.036]|nr:hypothetical protein ATG70_0556 [Bacillus sp. es.036]